ncbi:PadR family transcriptional regulator [Pseudaeromonas sp. ZJS20]|uniref:PadR family transcriptional regulator n=1 Tax=Pseudaeromonas aegiceratis TaxID=3153928 RepID=UPI00390CCF94
MRNGMLMALMMRQFDELNPHHLGQGHRGHGRGRQRGPGGQGRPEAEMAADDADRMRGHGPRGGRQGGPRHHGGRHGDIKGHGRRHRLFEHGEMRLVVLHLLASGPQHGYELIKGLQHLAGGDYTPSPGVIYPTLNLLEEMDLIALASEEGGKKRFAITEEGQTLLDKQAEELARILARLSATARIAQGRRHPALERALDNFKTALHLRLAQDDLSDETLLAMAAVLDKAAQDLERC